MAPSVNDQLLARDIFITAMDSRRSFFDSASSELGKRIIDSPKLACKVRWTHRCKFVPSQVTTSAASMWLTFRRSRRHHHKLQTTARSSVLHNERRHAWCVIVKMNEGRFTIYLSILRSFLVRCESTFLQKRSGAEFSTWLRFWLYVKHMDCWSGLWSGDCVSRCELAQRRQCSRLQGMASQSPYIPIGDINYEYVRNRFAF
jgi:hypothetical protein